MEGIRFGDDSTGKKLGFCVRELVLTRLRLDTGLLVLIDCLQGRLVFSFTLVHLSTQGEAFISVSSFSEAM